MAYLGLVPTESTSSEKRRQGGITKAGNGHARWLLIEAAQHYRLVPKVSKELSARQEGLSEDIKACSWAAQTRLHKRMMALLARGKQRNKVIVAIARELSGFVWHLPVRIIRWQFTLKRSLKSWGRVWRKAVQRQKTLEPSVACFTLKHSLQRLMGKGD